MEINDTNIQYVLQKRPIGIPEPDTWLRKSLPISKIKAGEILVKHHYISIDPAMRGWMNDNKSYIEPVAIGEVMRAGAIGKVVASKNERFKVGDSVSGWGGVQKYSITNGEHWFKIDVSLAPMPMYLGALGMTGMTAYFGLLEVGKPKSGDIVLVSGAAGAVGSLVGQIAKIKGCTVVGIAGSQEKCDDLVTNFGFDKALNYKSESFIRDFKNALSNGIDVYFDNVGGEILDLALSKLKRHARIVICGAISQYNSKTGYKGPSNYMSLLVNRATMQGMVVFDYAEHYSKASEEIYKWIKMGKIKSSDTIIDGIDNFYDAFMRLFSGIKQGKLLLKVI